MFVMLNSNGDEVGHYEGGPSTVSKKVAREIYKNTGKTHFNFKILNKKTRNVYSFAAKIHILKNPEEVNIGNNTFLKKYDIEIMRV